MKRLQDYLNKNFDSIYENFEADHKLTEEEINESMNRIINEGFWDFLTSFFKSIFGDGVSKDTQKYAGNTFDYFKKEYGENISKEMEVCLKEKKVKDFIKKTEETRKDLLKLNNFKNEKESYVWAYGVIKIQYFALKDTNGNKKDLELLLNKYNEYYKLAGNEIKDFSEAVPEKTENTEKDDNINSVEAPSKEFGEGFTEALTKYKDSITKLCKMCNTLPEQIQKIVYILGDNEPELKSINDVNACYGLILMACGAYLTNGLNDRKNVISRFMGTIAMLIENKNLQIDNKDV